MSRNSQAKKARRKKRQAARDASWVPAAVFDDVLGAETEFDEISEAVAVVDEWIVDRGWVLDTDNAGEQLVSWVYPPSAAESGGTEHEPVTRIWIVIDEDDEALVLTFGAVLVGFGVDDEPYVLDPDSLPEDIAALEAYRPGLPRPVL